MTPGGTVRPVTLNAGAGFAIGAPYVVAIAAHRDEAVLVAAVHGNATGAALRLTLHGGPSANPGAPPDGETLWSAPTIHGIALRSAPGRFAVICPDHVRILIPGRGEPTVRQPIAGVSSLEFGAQGETWLHRGLDLMRASPDEPGVLLPVQGQVLAFCLLGDDLLLAEFDAENHRMDLVVRRQDNTVRLITGLPLPDRRGIRVDLCESGGLAYLTLRPVANNGMRGRTIFRVDLARGVLLDRIELPALAHMSLRDTGLQPWLGGGVLTLAELDGTTALCRLDATETELQRLSAASEEVLDVRADGRIGVVAYTHVDHRKSGGPRGLTTWRSGAGQSPSGSEHSDVAAAFAVDGGAVSLVRRSGSHLELCTDAGTGRHRTWVRWPEHASHLLPVCSLGPTAQWDRTPPPRPVRRPLVALIPGLHKLVTSSPQAMFLQEFLVRIIGELDRHGMDACMLQIPGSAGRGTAYRTRGERLDEAALARHTREAIDRLTQSVDAPVGILSASLGAVGVVGALSLAHGANPPCALLSPVLRLSAIGIPDSDTDATPAAWSGTGAFLILHGARDEVAPFSDSQQFVEAGLPGQRRLVALEGQGHIPAHWSSWQTIAEEITAFFCATLLDAGAVQRRHTDADHDMAVARTS